MSNRANQIASWTDHAQTASINRKEKRIKVNYHKDLKLILDEMKKTRKVYTLSELMEIPKKGQPEQLRDLYVIPDEDKGRIQDKLESDGKVLHDVKEMTYTWKAKLYFLKSLDDMVHYIEKQKLKGTLETDLAEAYLNAADDVEKLKEDPRVIFFYNKRGKCNNFYWDVFGSQVKNVDPAIIEIWKETQRSIPQDFVSDMKELRINVVETGRPVREEFDRKRKRQQEELDGKKKKERKIKNLTNVHMKKDEKVG